MQSSVTESKTFATKSLPISLDASINRNQEVTLTHGVSTRETKCFTLVTYFNKSKFKNIC